MSLPTSSSCQNPKMAKVEVSLTCDEARTDADQADQAVRLERAA